MSKTPDRVVKKFYADWCAPCKAFTPKLEQVAEEFGAGIVNVNIEEHPEEARAMNVRSIPSIFFYEGDELKGYRMSVGNTTLHNLRTTFEEMYD